MEALDRLSELFPNIPRPKINLGCERTCPDAYRCTAAGCYRNGVINIKSNADLDTLIHEYGHHIFHIIAGNHIDPVTCEQFARAFEYSLRNQVLCESCGYPVIYDGSGGLCLHCGETYVRDYQSQMFEVVGKGLLVGIATGLLSGFITGLIPPPPEASLHEKIDRLQKLLAGVAFSSLVTILTFSM